MATHYTLLKASAITQIQEDLESAVAADAKRAEDARDIAEGYASDAVSQGNVPIYASVQTVEGLNIPPGITAIRTNGYNTPGDGGGALYVVGDEGPGAIQSGDGRWWEISPKDVSTASFSDESGLGGQVEAALSVSDKASIPAGNYVLTNKIVIDTLDKKHLSGVHYGTNITTADPSSGNLVNFYSATGIHLSDLSIDHAKTSDTDSGHSVVLRDVSDAVVSDIVVKGQGGSGTGVMAYPSSGMPKLENIRVKNVDVTADRDIHTNNNGVLLVDAGWSQISSVFAQGIGEFPVEYKNGSHHSLISDVLVRDSQYGLYNGQTSGEYPSYIASTNAVIKDARVGVNVGGGSFNSYSNIIYDTGDSGAEQNKAIRYTGSLSATWGLLTAGDHGNTIGVVYEDGSTDNFTQIAAFHDYAQVLYLGENAEGNVTEVAHPGNRRTLLDSGVINLTSRGRVYGEGGNRPNPIYSHATGEYLGCLSGAWKWLHSRPAGSNPLNASDRFVYGMDGGSFSHTLWGSDGVALKYAAKTPSTSASLDWNSSNERWELKGTSFQLNFSNAAVFPKDDDTHRLGAPGNRWSEVFATNGTINTSDARLKTEKRPLSNAEVAVAIRLSKMPGVYQWLSAIEKKGAESARLHVGVLAQDVQDAFESEGLDGFRYGVLCYDEWESQEEILDADGNIVSQAQEAGNVYSIRYDELAQWQAAGWNARLQALEKQVNGLSKDA